MDDDDALVTISVRLLEVVQALGAIEERLGHIEALVSPGPVVTFDFERGEVSDLPWKGGDDTQSVQRRLWDPTAGRWVYLPEPE